MSEQEFTVELKADEQKVIHPRPGSALWYDVQMSIARDEIADLQSRLAAAEEKGKLATDALEKIANDPDEMACSDIPHCQGIGPFGHAEDCALGIALVALDALDSKKAGG